MFCFFSRIAQSRIRYEGQLIRMILLHGGAGASIVLEERDMAEGTGRGERRRGTSPTPTHAKLHVFPLELLRHLAGQIALRQ